MNWTRILSASCALTMVTLAMMARSTPASASQPLRQASDIARLCRYSDVQAAEGDAAGGESIERRAYHAERRRLVHEIMEVTIDLPSVAIIGYDRITGVLSISGFRDHSLFDPHHFLRFREGCALHFDVSEESARDIIARSRVGTVALKIGFVLSAHEDYDQPLCVYEAAPSSGPAAGFGAEGAALGASFAADSTAGHEAREAPTRTIVLAELVYAELLEPDGQPVSNFQTELGHQLHLRRVSQAIGVASRTLPRVEVTALRWTNAAAPADASTDGGTDGGALEAAERRGFHAWWKDALEAAAYPCYLRGLARNGRLQGAFVFRASVQASGDRLSPEILLDTLQVDEVSNCIVERVRALRVPQNDPLSWSSFKATMLFKLQ